MMDKPVYEAPEIEIIVLSQSGLDSSIVLDDFEGDPA